MFDLYTFPNGLKVVGQRLTHVRSCSVGCWARVGSMNETPGENGLSHFIEHMVFKGTERRSARDIAEEMDLAGGQMNAYTSKECTCFYAKVTDDELPLAVDLLADMVLHPKFDPQELDKERSVVLDEIDMVEDTPDDLVLELLSGCQYSGSLRMPILGPKERISAYTREDLVRYWARHYTPDNMVVSIAGNYVWEDFLALVEKHFDRFPAEKACLLPCEPQFFLPGKAFREKDTEQVHIAVGYPGVESFHDDLYPLCVLSNALGAGMSARLFQRIREELGLVYTVLSYTDSYRGTGSFNIYAAASPENAGTVVKEIREQIALFLRDGMTEKEFRSGKAQLRGGYLLGLESSGGRMQAIGRSVLLCGEPEDPGEIIRKIEAVTEEETMALARRLLSAEAGAAVVGPGAKKTLSLF